MNRTWKNFYVFKGTLKEWLNLTILAPTVSKWHPLKITGSLSVSVTSLYAQAYFV
jgi:hypothetical protein